jgi:hypothetical protein
MIFLDGNMIYGISKISYLFKKPLSKIFERGFCLMFILLGHAELDSASVTQHFFINEILNRVQGNCKL